MITATIRCPYEKELVDMFASEDKEFGNGRASYTLDKEGDELVFSVSANDFVALRAMLNAITKNLSIYAQVGEVVEEENGE
jgi:tRNA threonylcarbamoyladenosine modification (KEOPS) complex  Pcc1 subunit